MTLNLTGPDVTIGALETAMANGGKVHLVPESIYPGYIVDVESVETDIAIQTPEVDIHSEDIEPDTEPS